MALRSIQVMAPPSTETESAATSTATVVAETPASSKVKAQAQLEPKQDAGKAPIIFTLNPNWFSVLRTPLHFAKEILLCVALIWAMGLVIHYFVDLYTNYPEDEFEFTRTIIFMRIIWSPFDSRTWIYGIVSFAILMSLALCAPQIIAGAYLLFVVGSARLAKWSATGAWEGSKRVAQGTVYIARNIQCTLASDDDDER